MALEPHSIRFGRYELETRLGVGGMAEVWLARQEGPGGFAKRAVIKRILPGLAGDPEFVEMFLREARLAALLNHPNAVQIFDLGQVEESYYLVMEYIEGRSLRFLENQTEELGKSLELGFVACVLAGACAGLHHAHEQRGLGGEPLALVHRDVAPDNLLVSYEGVTKVIDFGIAKAFADVSRTKSGVVKGKYGYMSPEQVRGSPIDRRSDVYAMGVVLFEALSGERPFNGSPTETLYSILNDPPPSLGELRPELPGDVVALAHRMIAKNPTERPQTIREVELKFSEIAQREGWGQTEVARVARILGGAWNEASPMTPPPPSSATRAVA
jgi:eukaryotic-like serine/threonine-protein kinase